MRRRKRQRLAAMVVAALMIVLVCLTLSVIPAISANESTPDEQNSTAVLESALVYYSPNLDGVEAEPEETGVVTTETLPEEDIAPDHPYAALNLTFKEKELLACMAYSEARGESFEGQVAVIQVALNRYMHEAYSGTLSEILLAPSQFAVGNIYTEEQMDAVEEALAGYPALDLNTDVVYFSTGSLTYGTYYCTIGGHVFRTYH